MWTQSLAYTLLLLFARKRKQEAIDHPERFLLICLSCHNSIEPRRLGYRKKAAMD